MAMIPENPVVGGTVLRRASIASPNFVTGLTGWSINQDGSAEFNNLVVRNGQIISGTALYYSGTPSAANLVLAIAAANGTDNFGTAYFAGVTMYAPSAGHSFPVTLLSNANSAFFQYVAPSGGVQGQLILAVSAAAGTDPVTAAGYNAGLFGRDPAFGDTITTQGSNIFLNEVPYTRPIDIVGRTPADNAHNPFMLIDAPEQATASHIQMQLQGASPDGTRLAQCLIGPVAGAAVLAPSTTNTLEVQGGTGQTVMHLLADVSTTNALQLKAVGDTNSRFQARTDGLMQWGPGNAATDTQLQRLSANRMAFVTCDVTVRTVGRGLQVAEGTNAKMGTSVLVGGTVTVANTSVTANSRIFLTCQTPGGTPGFLRVSARTAGTSFTILSSSGTDTSTVAWLIMEPG